VIKGSDLRCFNLGYYAPQSLLGSYEHPLRPSKLPSSQYLLVSLWSFATRLHGLQQTFF
jgi:hypothetical protein